MRTCCHASSYRGLQVASFVKRNFILRSHSQKVITTHSSFPQIASASSKSDNSMEEYNSRWEKNWKAGPDGDGLKQGQLFDATKSSAALEALIADGSFGLGNLSGKRIFVPGCGRGYDLVTFVKAGAKEVLGLELAPSAVSVASEYIQSQLASQSSQATVIQGDFFTHKDESSQGYDVGYDYTFLCALMPEMRAKWGTSWHRVLRPGGFLVTLIFPVDSEMEQKGPPWPVTPELYKGLLVGKDGLFKLKSLEKVPDEQSHPGRAGKEYMAVWERQA